MWKTDPFGTLDLFNQTLLSLGSYFIELSIDKKCRNLDLLQLFFNIPCTQ